MDLTDFVHAVRHEHQHEEEDQQSEEVDEVEVVPVEGHDASDNRHVDEGLQLHGGGVGEVLLQAGDHGHGHGNAAQQQGQG